MESIHGDVVCLTCVQPYEAGTCVRDSDLCKGSLHGVSTNERSATIITQCDNTNAICGIEAWLSSQ